MDINNNQTVVTLEGKLDALKNQVTVQEQEKLRLSQLNRTLEGQVGDQLTKQAELASNIITLDAQKTALEGDIANMQEQVTEAENALRKAISGATRATEEAAGVTEAAQQLMKQAAEATEAAKTLSDKTNQAAAELKQNQADFEAKTQNTINHMQTVWTSSKDNSPE